MDHIFAYAKCRTHSFYIDLLSRLIEAINKTKCNLSCLRSNFCRFSDITIRLKTKLWMLLYVIWLKSIIKKTLVEGVPKAKPPSKTTFPSRCAMNGWIASFHKLNPAICIANTPIKHSVFREKKSR